MSGGAGFARRIARGLLRLYPAWFRSRYGEAYVAGAVHIWRRERASVGAVRSALRLVRLMVADAWASIAAQRRAERAVARGDRAGIGARLSGAAGEWRLAVRTLLRRPGYAALVVGTLGLAIGTSAAVYGALDRVVLRPLPYADGDRLAYLALLERERGWQYAPFTDVLERWRAGARTVEGIETYRQLSAVRSGDGEAEVLRVTGVSAGLTGMLGVRPLLGRMLRRDDASPGAPPVVMLSEGRWRRDWGADPSAIGSTLRLNDTIFTVVGVWPEAARLDYEGAPALFRVLPPDQEAPPGDFTLVVTKLRAGVAPEVVESELAGLLSGVEDVPHGVVPVVNEPYGYLGDGYVRGLWMVFAGGIVLLVGAVINAANVVLGRSFGRLGEMRIRMALGGSRLRLLRLFLVESTALATAGAAVGLVVMLLVARGLSMLEPGRMVPPGATGLQGRVLVFACALAGLAALTCALVPLLQIRPAALQAGLASSLGGRATAAPARARTILIGGQTALAVLLATGAALAGRSLVAVTRVDTGVDMDRLAIVSMRVSGPRYGDEESRAAYFERVRETLQALPGAEHVTIAPNPPLGFSVRGGIPFLNGEPEPVDAGSEFVMSTSAEPNFFDAMGLPLLRGRTFEPGETGAVIVNESFARSRGGDVIGRSLRFAGDTVASTIVGVAADVRSPGGTRFHSNTQLYTARTASSAATYTRFIVRTTGSPEAYLAEARARLAAIDPDIPLREATTGPRMIREATSQFRFVAFLLGTFASLGVVFAVAGVYGVVTLEVQRRAREVGVRMALGASRGRVVRDVLRRGLAPVVAGAFVGAVAALWTGPIIESLLFGVSARDPLSAGTGVALMIAVAALGCMLPALRAARVDPAVTLRGE